MRMAPEPTDAHLLDRFVREGEEAAFEALVVRHGPRVRAACRRILRDEHEAEDAVQATFLVLAGKAPGIAWDDSMGGWLHAVARRQALHARAGSARRVRREVPIAAIAGNVEVPEPWQSSGDPPTEAVRREVRRVVAEELAHLPDVYRRAIELCDLGGLTNQEAARRLGWPSGSISRRLDRGRALLRNRLVGRGLLAVALAAGIATAWRSRGPDPSALASVAVRDEMVPFRPETEGGEGLGDRLAAVVRSGRPPAEPVRLLGLARGASRVADRIAELLPEPTADRADWRPLVAEMRGASLLLAQAARDDDGPAALEAARRLEASCVRCHAIYHQ